MEARLLKTLLLVSAIIFAIQTADAFNLGTLQKSSAANISSGETTAFRLLLWSADEGEYSVSIQNTEAPKGWLVIALPGQFTIGGEPSGKTERIHLPSAKNTIDAKAVDIYITAPAKTTTGAYDVSLDIVAGNSSGTGFSLIQERKIRFKINVTGSPQISEENNSDKTVLIDISPQIYEKLPETKGILIEQSPSHPGTSAGNKAMTVILIAAILIIAWRLYKYD